MAGVKGAKRERANYNKLAGEARKIYLSLSKRYSEKEIFMIAQHLIDDVKLWQSIIK